MKKTSCSKIGFVSAVALAGALTGCVGYADHPHHAHAQPQPVYVESHVIVLDDYVYYPGYQVYYSSNRRQYIYQDGRSWVTRSAPPNVSVNVLVASPSVRLDFHDSPSVHHATVVREYPKNWAPPGSNHGNKEGHDEGNKKDKRGND